MIKLYHAPFTRSVRIYWLLEEPSVTLLRLFRVGENSGDTEKRPRRHSFLINVMEKPGRPQ